MALTEGHRAYDGELMSTQGLRAMFAGTVTAGVIQGRGEELSVFGDSTGMQVKVRPGEAWVGWTGVVANPQLVHYLMTKNAGDAYRAHAITGNGSGNPRIDRVVLRADANAKTVTTVVIQGTPAASPVAPAVVRAGGIYDTRLAQVYVAPAVTTITAGDVTDERDWSQAAAGVALDATDYNRTILPLLGPSRSLYSRRVPGIKPGITGSTTSTAYVNVTEQAAFFTGAVQHTIRLYATVFLSASAGTAYGRLLFNGAQIGPEVSTSSTTLQQFTISGEAVVLPNTRYVASVQIRSSVSTSTASVNHDAIAQEI